MTNILTFKVEIKGLEDKIWREIEINDNKTVADLAYSILASFDSLAYHLYDIVHGKDKYNCIVESLDLGDYNLKDAVHTRLFNVNFTKEKEMIMTYDFGTPTIFLITYLGSRTIMGYKGFLYPYIADGAGYGMLDDITYEELKEIVLDIDKKQLSLHYFTPGYDKRGKYDYRNFNVKTTNSKLKGRVLDIKSNYEGGE